MQKLTEFYEGLTGWLNLSGWFGVSPEFENGFVSGAGLLLALILIWVLIRMRINRRERCREITITGERGDMVITANAVREFVKRILGEFAETSLEGIKLKQRGNTLVLVTEVIVLPDIELVPLRDAIQGRIVEEAQTRLGIDRPFRVNVVIKSVEASERKVGRQSRPSSESRHKETEPEAPAFDALEETEEQ